MRLVSFGPTREERPGVLDDDTVIDLLAVDATLPPTLRAILDADCLGRVAEVRERAPASARIPLAGLRLGPPICDPSKIICLGMNYRDHAAEQGKQAPEFPMLFSKGPNVLCGSGDAVPYPDVVTQLDYEAEMAFVVGRRARNVPRDEANAYIAGYAVFMDLSARDLQYAEKQWFRGKSFDGAGPFGPWIVTRDEVPNPHGLRITMAVNGETLQDSNTGEMTYTSDFLLHHISRTMTLEPGDVVATGTPPGVGVFRKPPRFLQRGDQLAASVETLGTLSCTIV